MSAATIITDLFDRVAASYGEPVLVGWDEVSQWPEGTLGALTQSGMLVPASPSDTATCYACEEQCHLPVTTLPATDYRPASSFVLCRERDDTNRVAVETVRLDQWRISIRSLAQTVANLFEVPTEPVSINNELWRLGQAEFSDSFRDCFLSLTDGGEGNTAPMEDAVTFTLTMPGQASKGTVHLTRILMMTKNGWEINRSRLEKMIGPIVQSNVQPQGDYFCRQGKVCSISFEGEAFTLKDSVGLGYVQYLLRRPNKQVPVREMIMAVNPPPPSALQSSGKQHSESALLDEGLHIDADIVEDVTKRAFGSQWYGL